MIRHFTYALILLCSSLSLTATAQQVVTDEKVNSIKKIIAHLNGEIDSYKIEKTAALGLRDTLNSRLQNIMTDDNPNDTVKQQITAKISRNNSLIDSLQHRIDTADNKLRDLNTALMKLAYKALTVPYNESNIKSACFAYVSVTDSTYKADYQDFYTLLTKYEEYWGEFKQHLQKIEVLANSKTFRINNRNKQKAVNTLTVEFNRYSYFQRENKDMKIGYLENQLKKAREQLKDFPDLCPKSYTFQFRDILPQ